MLRPPLRLVIAVAAAVAVATVGVVTAVIVNGGSDETPRSSASGTPSDGVPGPPSDPGQATPSGPVLSPAEEELVDLLDPFTLRNCVPASSVSAANGSTPSMAVSAVPGVDAAVVCDADGVDGVRVVRYVDAATLAADVAGRSASVPDVGSCRNGENSVEDWGTSTRRLGAFICWTADARSNVFWTVDAERLGFEVSGDDVAELVMWWDEIDPLR